MDAGHLQFSEKSDIDLPNAKLAYTIIQSLLISNEALNDLLAVMAHVLDEDVAKALTDTNEWQNYIDSKRELENTRFQVVFSRFKSGGNSRRSRSDNY